MKTPALKLILCSFLLILFLVPLSNNALAQKHTPRIVEFEGKKYNLFPIRHNARKPWYSRRVNYEVQDIPITPFKLPDGEYLIYYKKIPYRYTRKKNIPQFKHKDTVKVYATFHLKNNKREGSATWYTYKKQKVEQRGQYVNDLNEGEWVKYNGKRKTISPYVGGYIHGAVKGFHKGELSFTTNYKNGIQNGMYVDYYKGKISEEGVYDNGSLKWRKTYFKKGQLQGEYSYFPDSSKKLNTFSRYYKNGQIKYSFKYKRTNNDSIKPDIYTSIISDLIYVVSSKKKYYGKVNYFHKNGTIKLAMDFDNGFTKPIIMYNDKGEEIQRVEKDLQINDSQFLVRFVRDVKVRKRYKDYAYDPVLVSNKGNLKKVEIKKYHFEYVYFRSRSLDHYRGYIPIKTPFKGRYKQSSKLLLTAILNDKGDTLLWDAKSEFINYCYPNELGFKLAYRNTLAKSKFRKDRYFLLKSPYVAYKHINIKKKLVIQDFNYSIEFKDGDTLLNFNETYLCEDPHLNVKFKSTISYFPEHFTKNTYFPIFKHPAVQSYLHEMPETYKGELSFMGRPFDDKLKLKLRRYGRIKNHFYKLKLRKKKIGKRYRHVGGPKYDTTYILKQYNHNNGYGSPYSNSNFNLTWENGHLTSLSYYWSNKSAYYYSSKMSGTQKFGYNSRIYYSKGKAHGVSKGNNEFKEYFNGVLNGEHIKFDRNNQIMTRTYYVNDTLHGKFERFYQPYVYKEKYSLNMGLPHGEYISFKGVMQHHNPKIKAKFFNGFLVDTALIYFDREDLLKATVVFDLKDSVPYQKLDFIPNTYNRRSYRLPPWGYYKRNSYRYFQYNRYGRYNGSSSNSDYIVADEKYHIARFDFNINGEMGSHNAMQRRFLFDFDPQLTGNYTYYNKNGLVARQGRVEDGKRVGKWQVWDPNGTLIKEIQYDTGSYIHPKTKERIKYYAKLKSWYPNGNRLLEGLVTSFDRYYRCDQEMNVKLENLYYNKYYDSTGALVLTEGTGPVKEFHMNGEKRLEGKLENGKKIGLWRYFDENGNLNKVGTYVNDLEDGRWLSGDLAGIHFVDNMCYSDVTVFQAWLEEQKVTITEEYFSMGISTKSNTYKMNSLH